MTDYHECREHIRKVSVGFVLRGPSLDAEAVTKRLCLNPTAAVRKGQQRIIAGRVLPPCHDAGYWRIESTPAIDSIDINDHFGFLLNLLSPLVHDIKGIIEANEVYFDVLWESTYLYAGAGPVISNGSLRGMAELGADVCFDIYQVNEESDV